MNQKNLDPMRPLVGDSVAIVGFGPTSTYAPWEDLSWEELWLCNRLPLQPHASRWTRHFDPHLIDWSRNHFTKELWEQYEAFLKADHGDKISYLAEPRPEYPNSVLLPVQELINLTGRRYFTSVIAYQLGMAMLLGAKRIGLWGVDFRSDTEFEFERPCAEYLLGMTEGRGIELVIPSDAAMLNVCNGQPLYGVEEEITPYADVEILIANRLKEIKEKMPGVEAQHDEILKQIYIGEGARLQSEAFLVAIREARRGGALHGARKG